MAKDFLSLHKYVTLAADMMFVNGNPFLIVVIRGFNLNAVEHGHRRTARQLGYNLTSI